MKYALLMMLVLASSAFGQMEKRDFMLYDRKQFRARAPLPNKAFPAFKLKDLNGKVVDVAELAKKGPVIVISGAYT